MKINELAKINPKTKLEYNSFINYIDTSSVIDGALLGVQYLDKDYPSRAQRVVEKFDILISSVRPNLKHNYFVKVDKENFIKRDSLKEFMNILKNVLDKKELEFFLYRINLEGEKTRSITDMGEYFGMENDEVTTYWNKIINKLRKEKILKELLRE